MLDGPLPYLMDRHTHARCTGALHAALAWARKQPGNGARIYDRVSGRVIARYCQAPSGDLGCLLYSPQGKTVYARNKHTFRGHRASDARETLVETVTVDDEASAAYILWKNYAAARRHVLTMMRERGEQLNPQKLNTLRALLQHYGLDLSDEVAGRPDVNAGTLLFPAEYYDAERVRCLLSCMSAYVWPGSSVIARVGERHVKIRFGYSDYLQIDGIEEQAELDRKPHFSSPCYSVTHPDGGSCEARELAQFDAAALDVLLWRLLFVENRGEYQGGLDADYDPRTTFVAETIDLVVPELEEEGRLQTLIQLASQFFTREWSHYPSTSLSPAALTLLNVRTYIEELYHDHWYEVVGQAKRLLQQQ